MIGTVGIMILKFKKDNQLLGLHDVFKVGD